MNVKIFNIDWDNLNDINLHIQKLKSRKNHLETSLKIKPSKNDIEILKFDAMNRIISTNIDELYNNYELSEDRKYYVYCHLNPEKPVIVKGRPNALVAFSATLGMNYLPFYVGKGSGDRYSNVTRNETHKKVVQYLKQREKEPIIHIIKDNLIEKEALSLESKLIDIYGLDIYGGYLTNLDEGANVFHRRNSYKEDYKTITQSRINFLEFKKKAEINRNINTN